MNVRRDKTGINDRGNIILDKSAVVSGFAAASAKIIFPRRERTKPNKILNEKTPNQRGQMQFPNPTPIQNEQSAKHRKKYKAEMNDQNKIGCQTKNHRVNLAMILSQ